MQRPQQQRYAGSTYPHLGFGGVRPGPSFAHNYMLPVTATGKPLRVWREERRKRKDPVHGVLLSEQQMVFKHLKRPSTAPGPAGPAPPAVEQEAAASPDPCTKQRQARLKNRLKRAEAKVSHYGRHDWGAVSGFVEQLRARVVDCQAAIAKREEEAPVVWG